MHKFIYTPQNGEEGGKSQYCLRPVVGRGSQGEHGECVHALWGGGSSGRALAPGRHACTSKLVQGARRGVCGMLYVFVNQSYSKTMEHIACNISRSLVPIRQAGMSA